MDGLNLARRMAQLGGGIAIVWSFVLLSNILEATAYPNFKEILEAPKSFQLTHQVVYMLHSALVLIYLPVLFILKNRLRKIEDTIANMGFFCALLFVVLVFVADVTQYHVWPRILSQYYADIRNIFPEPDTDILKLFYAERVGSIPFLLNITGHFFFMCSMIFFSILLMAREKSLTYTLLITGGLGMISYLAMTRGLALAQFGLFAFGIMQAVLLISLSRRFTKLIFQRDNSY